MGASPAVEDQEVNPSQMPRQCERVSAVPVHPLDVPMGARITKSESWLGYSVCQDG